MDIFISYSSHDAQLAEQLVYRLRSDGHSVFFDRQSLPPGEAYDQRIREAIEACDRFVFLVSPASIAPGSYALSELSMARERWPSPVGRVLPVEVGAIDYDLLPPYLGAVTVFRTGGDLVAELVALISGQRRRRLRRGWLVGTLALLALAVVAGGAWWMVDPRPPAVTAALPSAPASAVGPTPTPTPTPTPAPAPAPPPAPPPAPSTATATATATAPAPAALAEPVRLIGMLGNTGWTITLDIVGEARPREVFVRWAGEADFRSTGLAQVRDPRTGLAQPNLQIESEVDPAAPLAPRRLEVRFDDITGRSHGPFATRFDPQAQVVAWTRQVLDSTASAWIAFREYPAGHRLVYFTHLLAYKNGLREIRYSVDDASLSKALRFKPDWSGPGAPRLAEGEPIMVEIAMAARFVEVQLVLADGSVLPARRFTVRPG